MADLLARTMLFVRIAKGNVIRLSLFAKSVLWPSAPSPAGGVQGELYPRTPLTVNKSEATYFCFLFLVCVFFQCQNMHIEQNSLHENIPQSFLYKYTKYQVSTYHTNIVVIISNKKVLNFFCSLKKNAGTREICREKNAVC